MFHAPEAARSDGAFLGRVRDVLLGGAAGAAAAFGRAETHFRGRGEGAEEAGEEVRGQGCHDQGEDGEDEALWGELQFEKERERVSFSLLLGFVMICSIYSHDEMSLDP